MREIDSLTQEIETLLLSGDGIYFSLEMRDITVAHARLMAEMLMATQDLDIVFPSPDDVITAGLRRLRAALASGSAN